MEKATDFDLPFSVTFPHPLDTQKILLNIYNLSMLEDVQCIGDRNVYKVNMFQKYKMNKFGKQQLTCYLRKDKDFYHFVLLNGTDIISQRKEKKSPYLFSYRYFISWRLCNIN